MSNVIAPYDIFTYKKKNYMLKIDKIKFVVTLKYKKYNNITCFEMVY